MCFNIMHDRINRRGAVCTFNHNSVHTAHYILYYYIHYYAAALYNTRDVPTHIVMDVYDRRDLTND